MFDIASSELLLIALVALLVIGPKDLPKVLRVVGQWLAKARGIASHFRLGLDEMVRQAELEELEKKWKLENERIMRETPSAPEYDSIPPEDLEIPSAEVEKPAQKTRKKQTPPKPPSAKTPGAKSAPRKKKPDNESIGL
jgi:sec-independent protein translocase protein TatB